MNNIYKFILIFLTYSLINFNISYACIPDECSFNPGSGETCAGQCGAVGSGCRDNCTSCGDAQVQTGNGETCDGSPSCDVYLDCCRPPGAPYECTRCGDNVTNADETCDGSSGLVGSGCRPPTAGFLGSASCSSCGDNITNGGELCDNLSGVVGTGCRAPFQPGECTSCGDGVVEDGSIYAGVYLGYPDAGEECEPPGVGDCDSECHIIVSSFCGDGNIDDGEECDGGDHCLNDCTILPPPILLSVVSAGHEKATLTWTTVTKASGYKIKYGIQSGIYQTEIDVGNVTTYVVNGLEVGIRHYFVVDAYKDEN